MEKKVTPGEIVVMVGGGVALIFSFLPFYSGNFGLSDRNAWSSGLFPVATLIVLFAVVAAAIVALVAFANVKFPPDGFLGFSLNALLLALTFFAAILALAYLIIDRGIAGRTFYDLGVGFWFLLLGSIATLVGAILMMIESQSLRGTAGPPTGPPSA